MRNGRYQSDSSECWYRDDVLHREDGPAIELLDGNKYWHLNGEKHREDGPAIEYFDGTKYWYFKDDFRLLCNS